jgi:hypothetical protein
MVLFFPTVPIERGDDNADSTVAVGAIVQKRYITTIMIAMLSLFPYSISSSSIGASLFRVHALREMFLNVGDSDTGHSQSGYGLCIVQPDPLSVLPFKRWIVIRIREPANVNPDIS